MFQSGIPTVTELLDAMRDEETFARLLTTYELTEDDVVAQVRAISRKITVALESRAGR
jgi:hypothetical protein